MSDLEKVLESIGAQVSNKPFSDEPTLENEVYSDEDFNAASPEEIQAALTEQPQEVSEEAQETEQEEVQPTAEVTEEKPVEETVTSSYTYKKKEETEDVKPVIDDNLVAEYLSKRFETNIESLENLVKPKNTIAQDPEVEAFVRFKTETGRSLDDFMRFQSLNTSEMDDMTAIALKYQMEYPELTVEERNEIISDKYRLDEDIHEEREVRLSRALAKADAAKFKKEIESLRSRYLIPEQKPQPEPQAQSPFDETWKSQMQKTIKEMEAIEFDVDGKNKFSFAVDQGYKNELAKRNLNVEETLLGRYFRKDSTFDHEMFNADLAVIDNIETIVKEAVKYGMGLGQKKIVEATSNPSAQSPRTGGKPDNTSKEFTEMVTRLMALR